MNFVKRSGIPSFLLCLLSIGGLGMNEAKAHELADTSFRVVGYLPLGIDLYRTGMPDLGKITHLNIAFLTPDSAGVFGDDEEVHMLTAAAHAKGVAVLLSIGGGGPPRYLKKLVGKRYQAAFVQALVALTELYQCEGIDVDLEGDLIDGNYESFVK